MKRKEQYIYSLTDLVSGDCFYFPSLTAISKYFGKSRSWAFSVIKNNNGYWKHYLIRKEDVNQWHN